MASIISGWEPPDGLAPQAQPGDPNVTSTPTDILPSDPVQEKAILAPQKQAKSTGWGAPYPETTITGTFDWKCLATGKKVR